jgi:LemA protein
MAALIIVAAFLLVLVYFVVSIYNRLVAARNDVRNLWRQIDVQLKRRYDLIPNLVQAVKDVMSWEQETLTQVIEARGQAVRADGAAAKNKAEGILDQALGRLMAVVERYPELKSNANVAQLKADLTQTENAIAGARGVYNNSVRDYSNLRESIPTNIVAAMFNFEPAAYFEAAEGDKVTPKVALR